MYVEKIRCDACSGAEAVAWLELHAMVAHFAGMNLEDEVPPLSVCERCMKRVARKVGALFQAETLTAVKRGPSRED